MSLLKGLIPTVIAKEYFVSMGLQKIARNSGFKLKRKNEQKANI